MSGVLRGKLALDRGAGLTVIPQRMVASLARSPHREVWARSFDASYSLRSVYFVRFVLEGDQIAVMQCLAVERETVLIGRNVLNRFIITLDGRNLRFSLRPA
jgi:predicted aspartyl protease